MNKHYIYIYIHYDWPTHMEIRSQSIKLVQIHEWHFSWWGLVQMDGSIKQKGQIIQDTSPKTWL